MVAGDVQSITASVRSTASTVRGNKIGASLFSQSIPLFPFLGGLEYRPRTALSFFGIFVVAMQFLGFVFNLHLRHGETFTGLGNIFYVFQLPLFDDTFLGSRRVMLTSSGSISSNSSRSSSSASSTADSSGQNIINAFIDIQSISLEAYAALFYVAATIPIALTMFVIWFLFSGLPVRRNSWYFTVVKITLQLTASVLFIPLFQSYLSVMVCINDSTGQPSIATAGSKSSRQSEEEAILLSFASSMHTNSASDQGSGSGALNPLGPDAVSRLWLFPTTTCNGSFFWANFVVGIIASVCLIANSFFVTLFVYDSDPLTRSVRGRSSSKFEVALLMFKVIACILFHTIVSQQSIKHFFPMFIMTTSLLMMILGAVLLPYFQQETLRMLSSGFAIVFLASFLTFLTQISTDYGLGKSNSEYFNSDWMYSTSPSGSSGGMFGPFSSPYSYSNSPYPLKVNFFTSMDLDALLFFTFFIPIFWFGRFVADWRINNQLAASLPALLDSRVKFIHPTILFPRNLPFGDLDVPLYKDICHDIAERAQELYSESLLQREMYGGGSGGSGGSELGSSFLSSANGGAGGLGGFAKHSDENGNYEFIDLLGDFGDLGGGGGAYGGRTSRPRYSTNFNSNNDPMHGAKVNRRRRLDTANGNNRPWLLTPFLTAIYFAFDIETSTRFLRVFYLLTSVWPNPHMLLLATRIYTKGMTKYRGHSRLITNFAQFTSTFVSKPSLALSQLEKVQRLEASLATRYRTYKLQFALKSEINIRESTYQQQVDAAKKLHKETLMHIESFWGKILSGSSSTSSFSMLSSPTRGRNSFSSTQNNNSSSSSTRNNANTSPTAGSTTAVTAIDPSHLAAVASMISTRRIQCKSAFLHALAHGNNDRLLLAKFSDFIDNVLFDSDAADHLRSLTENESEERKMKVMRGNSRGSGSGGMIGGGGGNGANATFSAAITDVLTSYENASPDITATAVFQQRTLWLVIAAIIVLLGGFLIYAFLVYHDRTVAIQCAQDVGLVRALVSTGGMLALQHMLGVRVTNPTLRLAAIEDTVTDILTYHNRLVYGAERTALGNAIHEPNLVSMRYVTPNTSLFQVSSLVSIGYDSAHQLQSAVRLNTVAARDAVTDSIIEQQKETLKRTFIEGYGRWYPAALTRASIMCDARLQFVDETAIIVLTVLFAVSLLLILAYAIIVALNASHADQFRASVLSLFPMIPREVTKHLHQQAVERVQLYDKREDEDGVEVHLSHQGGRGSVSSDRRGSEGLLGSSDDNVSSSSPGSGRNRRLSGSFNDASSPKGANSSNNNNTQESDDEDDDDETGLLTGSSLPLQLPSTLPGLGGNKSSFNKSRGNGEVKGVSSTSTIIPGGSLVRSSSFSKGSSAGGYVKKRSKYDENDGSGRGGKDFDDSGRVVNSGANGASSGGSGKSRRSLLMQRASTSNSDDDSDDDDKDEDDDSEDADLLLFEKSAVMMTIRQLVAIVISVYCLVSLFVIGVIMSTSQASNRKKINNLLSAAAAVFPSFGVARSLRFQVMHYIAFPVPAYTVEAHSYMEALFSQLSSVSALELSKNAVQSLLIVIQSASDLFAKFTKIEKSIAPYERDSDSDFIYWNKTLSECRNYRKQVNSAFTYDEPLLTLFRTLLDNLRDLCAAIADNINVRVVGERVMAGLSIAMGALFIMIALLVFISLRNNRALFYTKRFGTILAIVVGGITVGIACDMAVLVEISRFSDDTVHMTEHVELRYDSAIAITNTLILARNFIVSGDELSFKYYEDKVATGDGVDVFLRLRPTEQEVAQFKDTAARRRKLESIAFRLTLPSLKKPIPDAQNLYGNVSWDFDAEGDALRYRQRYTYDPTLYTRDDVDTRKHPREQHFMALHLIFSPRFKAITDDNANLMQIVYDRRLKELSDRVQRSAKSGIIAASIGTGFKGLGLVIAIIGLAIGVQTYVTNLSRTNRAAATAAAKGSSAYSSIVTDRRQRATLMVRISIAVMAAMFIALYVVGYLSISDHTNAAKALEAGSARESVFAQTMIVAEKLASGYISNITAANRFDTLMGEMASSRHYIITTDDNIVSKDEKQIDFIYGVNVQTPASMPCGFAPNGSLSFEQVMSAGSSTGIMTWRRAVEALATSFEPSIKAEIMNQLRVRIMPSLKSMRYSSLLLGEHVIREVNKAHWAFVGIVLALIAIMILMAIFVIRPLVQTYTDDVGGSKLLLKLIPQSVREEIPAIAEFMEMDLQEGFAGNSGSGFGIGGGGGGGLGLGSMISGVGGRNSGKTADSLAEPSNVAVIAIDANGIVLKYNTACEEVFGFSAAEVIGNNVSILMPNRIASKHDYYLAKYRVTGQRKMIGFDRNVHARHQQGYLFPIDLNIKEYQRSNGETVFFGFVRPIAKKLELKATDELNNLILEFAPLPMCAIDALGTVIRFNKAAEVCFGHAASDVLQQNVKMLMPEEFAARHDSYLATYLRTHEKHVIDSTRRVTGLRKSGDVFPMDISVKEVKANEFDDGMSTFLGYIRDVTLDIQLHKASLITEAVANLAPVPVIGINAFGKVLKFNTAASKLFGYEANKVIGHNVKMLMPDHIASEHDRYLEEYANTGKKRLLGAERIIEAKKSDGCLFPIKLLIREIKSTSNSSPSSSAGSHFGWGGGEVVSSASASAVGDQPLLGVTTFIGYIMDLTHEREQNDLKMLGDAIVDTHTVALLTIDSRGILTRVNRALCFEFGYNEYDIVGKSVTTILPHREGDITQYIRWLTESVRKITGRRKSGELLQLEVTLEEVTDVDLINTALTGGGGSGGIHLANGMTSFMAHSGSSSANTNTNKMIGNGNPSDVFNVAVDPARKQSLIGIAGTSAPIHPVPNAQQQQQHQITSNLTSGSNSPPPLTPFERARSYVGYLRNITAEVALESHQAINVACLDISPVPIVVADTNGTIVQFSIAARKLWKYELSEIIGKNVSVLMPDHIGNHHREFIDRYNRTGVKKMIDNVTITEGQDKSGMVFPLEVCVKDITRPSRADPFLKVVSTNSTSPRHQNSSGNGGGGGFNSAAAGGSGGGGSNAMNLIGGRIDRSNRGGVGGGGSPRFVGNSPDGFGAHPTHQPDSDDETPNNVNTQQGGNAAAAAASPNTFISATAAEVEYSRQARYFIAYMRNASRDGEAQEVIERNDLISELSPVPLVQIDLYGTILRFNKAAEEEFGFFRDEVIGRNVRILIPDDIAKFHDQYVANYRKTRLRRVIGSLTRTKAKRKSGELFAVELMVDEVVVEGDPDQNTYIAYIRNVTDEQRLTKANQLSGVVSDLSPTPLVAINSKGIIVNFNEAACRTFKYSSASEVINHNVKMLMPDAVAAVHDGYLTAYAKTGEKHIVDATREVTAKRSDGTLFQVELAVKEIKHPGQEESTFLSYIRDLTFNMQIAHTKRVTDVVQSLSTVPMVIIDHLGIIQDVNRATPPMFGYIDEMELIGANVKILMTKDDADQHDHFISKYIRSKMRHVIDTTRPVIALRRDGTTFTAELSVRELDVPEDFANMRGTRTDSRALSTNTNSQYSNSVTGQQLSGGNVNGGSMGGGSSDGLSVASGSSRGGYSPSASARKFFIAYLRNMDDLREMERNLNINTAIMKGSAVPLIIIDKKGIVKQFVPAAEQFFGYKEADVIGKNVRMLMPPEMGQHHDKYLEEYNRTHVKKVVGTTRIVRARKANGTHVPVSLTVREIPSRTVGETDFIGYVEDQSKEHAVEIALATTVAVREMLPVAIVSINDKGIVREFNKEAEKFFGYERKEIVGQNVNLLMTQDVARVHDAYLEAYRRTLVRHIIGSTRSVVGKHKDGTELFIELQVSEFIVDQQRCFVGFANDRRASMELEQSNRINNAMISLAIHPIITIDSDNNINHFNSAAEKQFGYSFDEVYGQNVKLLMPNEVAVHHDDYIARYKATNQSRVINQLRHVTAQRKNGDRFRAEITVNRIDHDGQILFVAYCRDISKELEARSNAIFANAISSLMPDPFIAINSEGVVLVYSYAACQLFEYSQADVVGCNVSMLMPADVAAEHNGYLKRYQQNRKKHIIGKKRRVIAKTKSGKLIDVELHINEKIIEGKRFFFGYIRDCTHDFELALQTEIGEALVETNPDAIITIDTSGIITRFNVTAEHLFQFDRHLVIGKNVNILMPAMTARRHDQFLANYMRTGIKRIVDAQNPREVVAEKKNGDTFPAYLSVRQLLDTEGKPSMFIGFIRPI